ncbi:MAG: TIR domain-containing protein, partial [Planctomycetota bacterium]|nr:TIR domain-containing protein [Planctomycetota bacterium]
MPSAQGYAHDVFISYATVDDRPAKRGWVAAFVNSLSESLNAAFGLRDSGRIWWDRSNIDEEASLTEQIRDKVKSSACMVVILSRGYAMSQWCRQEREAFLEAMCEEPDGDRRLFLVDIGNLELNDRPIEFRDKRGRLFYVQPPNTVDFNDREPLGFPVPDPENKEHKAFFAQVDQLGKDLYERVSRLPGAAIKPPPSKTMSEVTLFVAESSDDVAEEREQVVRFLSDHFHVIPAIDDPLPARWEQWRSAVDGGLQSAKLFVQVLGGLPGKKIAGSDQKLVIAQYDRAREAGLRIVTWRKSPAETIADARLKELVAAAEFYGPLAEFTSEVKRIASPPPPVKVIERPVMNEDSPPPMVFIQAGVEDQS